MAFYFQDILFGIHRVVSPVFPVSFSATKVLMPINLGQLVVVKYIVPDFSDSSSLLKVDTNLTISKSFRLEERADLLCRYEIYPLATQNW